MTEKRIPQLGKYGGYQPLVCAATGQSVQGRHATTIRVNGEFYMRILNKAKSKLSKADVTAIRDGLLQQVQSPTKRVREAKE